VRRIPIHTKLAAALAVPLTALVAVAVVEAVQSTREADQVRDQASLVKAATGPSGLFNALQDERNRAFVELVGKSDIIELPVADNAAARVATDRALARFADQIDSQAEVVRAAYAPAFEELQRLPTVRGGVDADPGPFDLGNVVAADAAFWRYTALVDALLDANAKVAVAIDDPGLRHGADLSYLASRQTDLIARLVNTLLVASVSEGGLDTTDEITRAGGLHGQALMGTSTIEDLAVGDYAESGATLLAQHRARGFLDRLVPGIIETGRVDVGEVLEAVSVPRDESYYGFRTNVKEILEREADGLARAAEQRARGFQAVAVAAILGAVGAGWSVARSIARQLRALTRHAIEMANHQLPEALGGILDAPLGEDVVVPAVEPFRARSRDEVADLAEALNTVQASAVDLAVEQAVLRRNIADSFRNLGRRNQTLLGRQLDFITELESRTSDPDTLADLFRLDHLATRMRRNAESLLVLAGIAPPRQWVAPVRVTDVIRAALGEVEDYHRVIVDAVDPATVLGSVAADLTHLVAELVENALTYSPPEQAIEVRGRSNTLGTLVDGYTLAIVDAGLGMSEDELARANRRLAGAESFTVAPSKYLGHYVAGHLGARHGIDVTLHTSLVAGAAAGRGVTAVVQLPLALLTTQEPAAPPARRPTPATPQRAPAPVAHDQPWPALTPSPRHALTPASSTDPEEDR
jgi:HAMP domain